MAFWLSIDHALTASFGDFGRHLNALFDTPADNPFQVESSVNKTLVFSADAIANALKGLTGDAANVFASTGIGMNVQRTFHPNFNTFQLDQLNDIFEGYADETEIAALSDADKAEMRLKVFELVEYSRSVAEDGSVHRHEATHADIETDFESKYSTISTQKLQTRYDTYVADVQSASLTDVGSASNHQERLLAAQ